jgi:hypothetical protein
MHIDDASMMTDQSPEIQQRRSRAVITAWILGGIAVAIFAAFILSGVLGQ